MPVEAVIPENRRFQCEICHVSGSYDEVTWCELFHSSSPASPSDLKNKSVLFGFTHIRSGDERKKIARAVRIEVDRDPGFRGTRMWYISTFEGNQGLGSIQEHALHELFHQNDIAEKYYWQRTHDKAFQIFESELKRLEEAQEKLMSAEAKLKAFLKHG